MVANAYPGQRTENTRDTRTRVRVRLAGPTCMKISCSQHLRRESSASPRSSSSRSLTCRVGRRWHCKDSRLELQLLKLTGRQKPPIDPPQWRPPGSGMGHPHRCRRRTRSVCFTCRDVFRAAHRGSSIRLSPSPETISQPRSQCLQHWTHALAPANQRRFITWMQGWITWFAWVSTLAGVANTSAYMLQSLISANNPNYVPQAFHVTLIIFALLIFFGLANMFTWYATTSQGFCNRADSQQVFDPLARAGSRHPARRPLRHLRRGFCHALSSQERGVCVLEGGFGDGLEQSLHLFQSGLNDTDMGLRR